MASKKILKNGAGEIVEIQTTAEGDKNPLWWADTYRLSHRLSRGDRSTVLASLEQAKAGRDAVLGTAEGGVTNELWRRLCGLGYLEDTTAKEGMPDPLRFYKLTEKGKQPDALMAFLMASTAFLNEASGSPEGIINFLDRFLQLNHSALNLGALAYLRAIFFSSKNEVKPEPEETFARVCRALERAGAFERPREGIWRPTDDSTMIAPFVLDSFIHEKVTEKPLIS